MSWKAQVRRCTRDRRVIARGTHANQLVVAMARALAGFRWAMAKEVPVKPYIRQSMTTSIGSGAAPVGCHPRWREETGRLGPRVR
jgi:hypothetical protein